MADQGGLSRAAGGGLLSTSSVRAEGGSPRAGTPGEGNLRGVRGEGRLPSVRARHPRAARNLGRVERERASGAARRRVRLRTDIEPSTTPTRRIDGVVPLRRGPAAV